MDGPISTRETAAPAPLPPGVQLQDLPIGRADRVPPVSQGSASRRSGNREASQPAQKGRGPEGSGSAATRGTGQEGQEPAYLLEIHGGQAGSLPGTSAPGTPRASDHADSDPRDSNHAEDTIDRQSHESAPGREHSIAAAPLVTGAGRHDPDRDDKGAGKDGSKPLKEPEQDLAAAIAAARDRWVEVRESMLGPLPAREGPDDEPGKNEQEESKARESSKAHQWNEAPLQSFPDPSRYRMPTASGDYLHTPRFSAPTRTGLTSRALDPTASLEETPPQVAVSPAAQRQLAIRYQTFAMALSNPDGTRPIIDIMA